MVNFWSNINRTSFVDTITAFRRFWLGILNDSHHLSNILFISNEILG